MGLSGLAHLNSAFLFDLFYSGPILENSSVKLIFKSSIDKSYVCFAITQVRSRISKSSSLKCSGTIWSTWCPASSRRRSATTFRRRRSSCGGSASSKTSPTRLSKATQEDSFRFLMLLNWDNFRWILAIISCWGQLFVRRSRLKAFQDFKFHTM